jgi:hypothetical protein
VGLDGGTRATVVTADPKHGKVVVATRVPFELGPGSDEWVHVPLQHWRVSVPLSLSDVFLALASGRAHDSAEDSNAQITEYLARRLTDANVGDRVLVEPKRVYVKVAHDVVVQSAPHKPDKVRFVLARNACLPFKPLQAIVQLSEQ